jgi:hypothetical protein
MTGPSPSAFLALAEAESADVQAAVTLMLLVQSSGLVDGFQDDLAARPLSEDRICDFISGCVHFTAQRKFQGKWQPKLEAFDVALSRRLLRTPRKGHGPLGKPDPFVRLRKFKGFQ